MDEKLEQSYAGFWIRLVASFIDGILLIVITLPILYFTYGKAYFAVDAPAVMGYVDIIVSWFLPIVATLLFWIYRAGTPGKLILKLAVVDADTGKNLTVPQSIIRYITYIISALPLFLGYFWVAWDEKKQAWHDKLARSVVIMRMNESSSVESSTKFNA